MSLILDVFVSSPGDLPRERKVVGEVVAKLALQPHIRRTCSLRALFYEQLVPPTLASSAQAAVTNFVMDPGRCHVLVCLLGDRLGTPVVDATLDARSFRSGTEYELVTACESSQKPPPAVLVYCRKKNAEGTADPVERARLDEFLKEFEGPQARFRGLRPALFRDAEELRGQLADHLNAVVTPLVRAHVGRRVRAWTAGALALVAVVLLTFAGTRRAENARFAASEVAERERSAADEARTLLRAASDREGPWKEVEALDRLGCPSALPLLETLAEVDRRPGSTPPRAIVGALGKLAATPRTNQRCGCTELLSVLALANPVRRYCKSTHRMVLEELGRLTCPARDRVICDYLWNIRTVSPLKQVVCEGDTVDDVFDLLAVVRPWMGEARMAACLEGGNGP